MCYNISVDFMSAEIHGLVAQLGERCVRIAEVEGSIPFGSRKKEHLCRLTKVFFFSMK